MNDPNTVYAIAFVLALVAVAIICQAFFPEPDPYKARLAAKVREIEAGGGDHD